MVYKQIQNLLMKIHILVFAGRCNDRVRSTVEHRETAVSDITE